MNPANPAPSPARRGRPPSITRARIAEAGIAVGLPQLTFAAVAAALDVTTMALYKHVPNLAALKHLVAEEIFARWHLPPADNRIYPSLSDYLVELVHSLRAVAKEHPGLAPYLMRRSAFTTIMLAKMDLHHSEVSLAWGLPKEQVRWLITTIAFHCIAVADTVYALAQGEALPAAEEAEMEQEFQRGMQALIAGSLGSLSA